MFGLFSALYSSLAYTSGSFEEVFRKEGLTLDDLLDEEGVVNEFKRMNTKLHEFISNGQVDKLIEYVTIEPTDPNDKKHSYKYPYVSAELLSCENNLILNTFFPLPEPARSRKSTFSINDDRDIENKRDEETPELVNHQTGHGVREELSPTGPVEHIAQPGDTTPTLKHELTEDNLKFVKEEKKTDEDKTEEDKEKKVEGEGDEEEKKNPHETKKQQSTGSDEGDDNGDMVKIGGPGDEEMMKHDESQENDEENTKVVELPMLNKLFKFVDTTEPLNHTLAGYFFKVVNNLFNKRTPELVDYLFQYEDGKHIKNLARHMESRSIAELLAKILSFEASTFSENKYIDKRCKILEDELILSLLSSSSDPECISNVGYVVQDFIQKLHQTNAGREIFEKALCDDGVLNFIFSGLVNKSSQILINATTQILTTIAGHFINPSGDRGDENSRDGSEGMGSPLSSAEERFVEKYEKYMADMTKRLEEDAPVQAKLKVCEVLRHGILLRNSKLLQTIALKKVLGAILPLLTKHQWCNFLHYQIEKIIMAVLESGSEPLRRSLFKDGKLLEILEGGVVDQLHVFETTNKTRRGYLGYVTKLGNVLKKLEVSDSLISEEIKQNGEKWNTFCKEYLEVSNDNDSRDFALKEKETSQDADEPDTKAPFVFKLIKGTQLANMAAGTQGGRGTNTTSAPRYQQDNDDEEEENGRGGPDDEEEAEEDDDDDVHHDSGKHEVKFTLHQHQSGGQISKRGDDNSDEEDEGNHESRGREAHNEERHTTKRGEEGEEEPGFDQHNFWKTSHLGDQGWLAEYQ